MASWKIVLALVLVVTAVCVHAEEDTDGLISLLERFINLETQKKQALVCPDPKKASVGSRGILEVDKKFLDTICEVSGKPIPDVKCPEGELCCVRPVGKGLKSCQKGETKEN